MLTILKNKEILLQPRNKLSSFLLCTKHKSARQEHEFPWNKPVKFIQIFPKCNRAEPIPVPRAYYGNMTKLAQQSTVIGCIHLLMPEEDACLLYMSRLS